MRARAGRAVVLGASGEGGGVKGIDFGAALREEGDVRAVGSFRAAAVVRSLYPEFGIGAAIGDGLVFAQIQHAADVERRENLVVKGDGLRELVGAERDVREDAGVFVHGFLRLDEGKVDVGAQLLRRHLLPVVQVFFEAGRVGQLVRRVQQPVAVEPVVGAVQFGVSAAVL